MSTTTGQELRPVTSLWWLPLLFGVALGVGIFFVVSPHETLSTFTAIAGIFVLVDGVIAIVASIFGSGEAAGCSPSRRAQRHRRADPHQEAVRDPRRLHAHRRRVVRRRGHRAGRERVRLARGRGGNLLIALLDLAAGVVILAWPDLGLATVAVIIGIVLIMRGALFIAAGWQHRTLDRARNRTRARPPRRKPAQTSAVDRRLAPGCGRDHGTVCRNGRRLLGAVAWPRGERGSGARTRGEPGTTRNAAAACSTFRRRSRNAWPRGALSASRCRWRLTASGRRPISVRTRSASSKSRTRRACPSSCRSGTAG